MSAASASECNANATRLLTSIQENRYEEAVDLFGRELKAVLPAEKLKAVLEGLKSSLGRIVKLGPATASEAQEMRIVTIPVHFLHGVLDSRSACDSAAKIVGFRLVPHVAIKPQHEGYAPPPYAKPETYVERPVKVGPYGLAGKVVLPAARAPRAAVVLVHGSGPLDMDSSIGPNRPFADLAWGLGTLGIASIRYDKRTYARPDLFTGSDYSLEDEIYADVLAARALLAAEDSVDPRRIFLVGHSIGARLAPALATRAEWRGLILLAAPSQSLSGLLRRQVGYLARLDGRVSAREANAIEDLEARIGRLDDVLAGRSVEGPLPLNLPPRYLRDLSAIDAVALADSNRDPILVVHGDRDYLVTIDDDLMPWIKAASSNDRIQIVRFPMLNHLFQPGKGLSTPAEHTRHSYVSGDVVSTISDWISWH